MSIDDVLENVDDDNITKGQLAELIKGLEARIEHLEEENDQLREELDEKVGKDSVNLLLRSLTGADLDNYMVDPVQHRDFASDFHDRVQNLESTVKRHKDVVNQLDGGDAGKGTGAWFNIVEEAKRLQGDVDHDLPDERVRLYCEDISRATGRSERMASNYIEDFGQEKDVATWRPYNPPSAANNNEAQKKSLVVDLNVWGGDDE